MKKFIVFASSGKVLKTGVCADQDFALQGENVMEGVANDATQYVQNGVVVNMPPKPDGAYYFDYATKQWVQDQSAQENTVKAQRNQLLQQSDWTQLADIPAETKALWEPYRQALRDVTDQPGYPYDVIWPTPPTA
jgi:hypothetical protein